MENIKDFIFNDLFAGYSHEDTLVFAILTFLAFALGYLIAYFFGRSRRKKLKKELKQARHELNNTKAELAALQEQHELKTAALQKAELTAEDLNARVEILEKEKEKLHADLYAANEEIEKMNAAARSYAGTIDDLNNQIIGLKTKSNDYSETFGASDEVNLDQNALQQISKMQSTHNLTLQRLNRMEAKLSEIDSENEMLKAELDKMKSGTKLILSETAPAVTPDLGVQNTTDNGEEVLQEVVVLTDAQKKATALIGSGIPEAEAGAKDDLTLINGVGPFLEKKLNNIGIYTYAQISELSPEAIEAVTEAIEFFPGRIEKDDWKGQAKKLMGQSRKLPEAGRVIQARVGFTTVRPVTKEEDVLNEEILDADNSDDATTAAAEDAVEEILEETEETDRANAAAEAQEEAVEAQNDDNEETTSDAEEGAYAETIVELSEGEETLDFSERIEINPFDKYEQDDLKIIEGIGPKISQVLADAGITTWEKLAETQAEEIKEILHKAGNRYKIHDPSTWPQQAQFAANRNWKKLKEYQDYLVGGKDVAG